MNFTSTKKLIAVTIFSALGNMGVDIMAQENTRWQLTDSGSIVWNPDQVIPHYDHIEMSGLRVSTVLRYGVNADTSFTYSRGMVWPLLRTLPNDTHASLMRRLNLDVLALIQADRMPMTKERVDEISLDGKMTVQSTVTFANNKQLSLQRVLFPSVDQPAFCEQYTLTNTGSRPVAVEVPATESVATTDASKGVYGAYDVISKVNGVTKTLQPGEAVTFDALFTAVKQGETPAAYDGAKELNKRKDLISEYWGNLVLETPDPILNAMFAFAKIRGTESIYQTKGGLMHGPGGESYYAAIWANDQAEYINPFFPFLGNRVGNESALNSYMHFARFMNDDYTKVPSSIIAEGIDVWGGAGDRGDAAMIAYGAARYALARGDKKEAEQLWPLISWCLEYCKRNLNGEGVVASDSDELENRFPSGKANLCTSTLYYDALISAARLGEDIGIPKQQTAAYEKESVALRKAIDTYFGGDIEGFDSYKYYKENDILRSWICMPLTVGIYDRKDATIDALFSPRLWTENGLLTQAGSETFWDRSTLYALRGVFACGATEKGMEHLKSYSAKRLLGDHVPYAIEAWPEGNQRHLSAESGLYCRIITEGMFGIRPVGLRAFELTPRLPQEWDTMALRNVNAFGNKFDIDVARKGDKLQVMVTSDGKVKYKKTISPDRTVTIKL